MLSLKQVDVPRMFTPQIMPTLTNKQLEAFKVASDQGYYEFPRKTNLHKLAGLTNIARPTFEEHLRKAEIKFLRFMKGLFLK
jgi:predicted DNA binding protein